MRSVLLVAYGASAHVALHYALRHRARVAGVVVVGAVSELRERTLANALSRGVLRLAWDAARRHLGQVAHHRQQSGLNGVRRRRRCANTLCCQRPLTVPSL